jgi:hypothetical protein
VNLFYFTGGADHLLQKFQVTFVSDNETVSSVDAIFSVTWSNVIKVTSGQVSYASDVRLPSLGSIEILITEGGNVIDTTMDFGYLGGVFLFCGFIFS